MHPTLPARRRVRRLLTLALAGAAAAALTACGTTEEKADAEPAGSASGAVTGPITVTDARGKKLTLDTAPTRVVANEWGLIEQVASLGVQPVGIADVKGYNDWVSAAKVASSVTDIGKRGEPSLDTIGGLNPDLIVENSDVPANIITQLERVAPVLVVKPNDNADPIGQIRSNVELIGKALGRGAQAKALLSRMDAGFAAAKKKVTAAGLAGAPVAVSDGYREGSSVSLRMYTPASTWGGVLAAMGLKNQWTSGGDPDYGLAQTDVEGLTKLTNKDTRFLYLANKNDGGDVYAEVLAKNPVWQGLAFVQRKHVSRIPDGTWPFGGPLSALQFAERSADLLTRQN